MSAFVQMPLAEVCTIVGGGTPRRSNAAYFDGAIPWARPTDVTSLDSLYIDQTKEAITRVGLKESSARLVPAGTVLMTSRATIGYTAIAAQPMATNQGFANLICGERVEPEFLAYWLRDQRERLIQLAGGTTFRELPKSTLKKVHIPLPPLDEQRRIVGILNRAAEIERLRKRAQERLREFIQALFVRMFGYPATTPMMWQERRIGQVCMRTEIRNPRKAPSTQFRYVDISGIDAVEKRIVSDRLLVGADAPSRARKEIRKDDVIVSSVRPNLNAVAIVPDELDREIASTGFCVLRANRELIEPLYLFCHVTSAFFVETISSQTRGANYPAVSDKDIRALAIPVPPLREQQRFTQMVESALCTSNLAMRGVVVAEKLTASLMSRLLVKDA